MRAKWTGVALAAGMAMAFSATSSFAVPITETYSFDAVFSPEHGMPAPTPEISGSLTATFDLSDPTGATLDAFSSPDIPAFFTPVDVARTGNLLVFGNSCRGYDCTVEEATNQFFIEFKVDDTGSNPYDFAGTYSVAGSNQFYGYLGPQRPVIAPVPLPASAPMLGAALIVLGGAGYSRRRFRSST